MRFVVASLLFVLLIAFTSSCKRPSSPNDADAAAVEVPVGIEHLLFSQVSKNWAGEPLVDIDIMLNFIRTTKTATGLQVKATLMEADFPKGIKIADRMMANLNIIHHDVLPAWNYTIAPSAFENGKLILRRP